ncbi:hypothetical protein RO21_09740 [[Actinobacillus] muris]|uniref:Uncharacterized protein n=1 Tax=Muribacter muris TaxID=67855 RepID=A0A0J5P2T9_9PAST|nr:hypothetical protein [Muribacter muris]KMK50803.1 hypothetical protein RO21_09740 [[Actinobacillus] muris] [Muribacter muris]
MADYGIQLDNLQIKQDHRALNFLVRGETRAYGHGVEYFDFHSASQPTIFARPLSDNQGTAPHYLIKNGNQYRAYFLGRVEVFVFSQDQNRRAPYGIEIINEAGNKFFSTGDYPVKPAGMFYLPAIGPNGYIQWEVPNSHHIAYNLLNNRMSIAYGSGMKTITYWRDVVKRVGNAFRIEHAKVYEGSARGDDHYYQNTENIGALGKAAPTAICLINIANIP